MAIKFCTKCGRKFESVGREVICPACKATAAEESKRAAVLRAKRASWAGESVPVRISGRASTVIRHYGAANNLPFAESLDALLKSTDYFKSAGCKWEEVEPYKSRRLKKSTDTAQEAQDVPQDKQDKQEQEQEWINQIKKSVLASKASTSKAASKATRTSSKTSKSKASK